MKHWRVPSGVGDRRYPNKTHRNNRGSKINYGKFPKKLRWWCQPNETHKLSHALHGPSCHGKFQRTLNINWSRSLMWYHIQQSFQALKLSEDDLTSCRVFDLTGFNGSIAKACGFSTLKVTFGEGKKDYQVLILDYWLPITIKLHHRSDHPWWIRGHFVYGPLLNKVPQRPRRRGDHPRRCRGR